MAELVVGATFAGYRIEEQVGRGGMGVVYRAEHLRLRRVDAVKLIAPEYAHDLEFRSRFERETRVAALINHPHVISIHTAGEEDGQLYLAMQFVEGTDLRAELWRCGRFEPERALEVIAQVAAALDAAHKKGLVHRDVKPANVLLAADEDGDHAYLTDFGLTKRLESRAGVTGTGAFVGTPDYIAPEQVLGDPVDARADVYSLGCVLYHLLTGRVPYPRDHEIATATAHLTDPPPTLADVRPELANRFDPVISTAMAKNREERFASAGEFARAAQETGGVRATTSGGPSRGRTHRAVAPGWYLEPGTGRTRWWTGTDWGVYEVERRPTWWQRHRILTVASAIGAVVVGAAVALLLSGVFHSAKASQVDRSAQRTVDLANATSSLTRQIAAATSRLGGSAPGSAQQSKLNQLARQASALRTQANHELTGPAGSNADLRRANTAIAAINANNQQIVSDLDMAASHPHTQKASSALADAQVRSNANPGFSAQADQGLYLYWRHHPSFRQRFPHLFPAGGPKISLVPPVWSKAAVSSPPLQPQDAVAITYDAALGRVILFREHPIGPSGFCAGYSAREQTWAWDGISWKLLENESGPAGRTSSPAFPLGGKQALFLMTYDASHKQVVLIGAQCHAIQTWTFNGYAWRLRRDTLIPMGSTPPPSTPNPVGSLIAFDPSSGRVVLFGRPINAADPHSYTWTWNGSTWTQQRPPHNPLSATYAGIGPDPRQGGLILSGSASQGFVYAWRWLNGDWRRELTPEPRPPYSPAQSSYSFLPDTARQRLLLIGPCHCFAGWQQWAWEPSSTSWAPLGSSSTPNLSSSFVAYDQVDQQLVAVGGQPTTTWIGTEFSAAKPAGPPVHGGQGVVTTSGQIGELRLGTSTEADIRSVAGQPDAIAYDHVAGLPFPPYKALGYRCESFGALKNHANGFNELHRYNNPSASPWCQTIYYLNRKTGILAAFFTGSDKFFTSKGTRPGMSLAQAQRRERKLAGPGCFSGITLGTRSSAATLLIEQGRTSSGTASSTVANLEAESSNGGVGVTFC